ncbi:MAG: amidohydrolase family protein, partial [Gammaproteobacteria bacterium]
AWCGARPVDYLMDNFEVDESWSLIHATHMSAAETSRLAGSGAVAGICPTTEGNLGDGFFNATNYLQLGGKMGIGSDSHISISPVEELRWFEYGQRLQHHSRNQLAGGPQRSTGRTLFDLATAGGAQACGHDSGVIEVGKRADFVVLDTSSPLLCERAGDELLDSWIFSGNDNSVREVYVGGERVIEDGHHVRETEIQHKFQSALKDLRAS